MILLGVGAGTCDAQFLHKKKVNKSTSADNSAEPDKVLYLRALDEIKKGHQEIGRLDLQTLINTYPDSEYLAKAKLGIADSYFKEGGSANTTQAVQGYKDFIVFFPFLPEAPYAQLQVASAHYKEMAKPDRDRTEAREAEDEFQTFLQKYPQDPLRAKAEQRLRDVQEVLAEGDYRIAYYYYVKGDKRAAASRLTSVTTRYPLYSKSDHALWMLADLYETSEKRDIASKYYAQIVRDYPKSELIGDAKYKLKAFGVPIPQADPNALAWMTANANAPRPKTPLLKRPLDLIKSGPTGEIKTSARVGIPTMTAEGDSNTETLHAGSGAVLTTGGGGGSTGKSVVATVVPGTESGAVTGESVPGATDTGTATDGPGADSGAKGGSSVVAPAAGEATTDPNAAPAALRVTETADGTTPSSEAASSDDTSTSDGKNADGKESSSKKKKGLKKLIPW